MKGIVCLIVWAGANQSRSTGAEQTTQMRVYKLPLNIDAILSLQPNQNITNKTRHSELCCLSDIHFNLNFLKYHTNIQ